MPDCDSMSGLDAEQPQLCKAHCDRDSQSVNSVSPPDVVPAAVLDRLLTRIALWHAAEDADTLLADLVGHTGPHVGAPPVYLVFLVLRT